MHRAWRPTQHSRRLDKAYVKPGDARVIAHTKVIGGGETDSVSFDVSKLKAGDSYAWFCSFPGHASIMKGTLTLSEVITFITGPRAAGIPAGRGSWRWRTSSGST